MISARTKAVLTAAKARSGRLGNSNLWACTAEAAWAANTVEIAKAQAVLLQSCAFGLTGYMSGHGETAPGGLGAAESVL